MNNYPYCPLVILPSCHTVPLSYCPLVILPPCHTAPSNDATLHRSRCQRGLKMVFNWSQNRPKTALSLKQCNFAPSEARGSMVIMPIFPRTVQTCTVRGANNAKAHGKLTILHCENIGFSEAQIHHREGMRDIDPSIVGAHGSPNRTISKNNKPMTADCG